MSNIKYIKRDKIDNNIINNIVKETNLSPLIVEFMYNRGYTDSKSILEFINFKEGDLRKVSKMNDSKAFIERLAKAVIKKENIVIYGDYDADGVCATSIFIRTLSYLGINANYFINNKYKEGYGLCEDGIDRLLALYPNTNLIITCDNGVAAISGIKYAKTLGLEVMVTDHHNALPDGTLPNSICVCETRLDEDESLREGFCGTELVRRLCVNLIYYLKQQNNLQYEIDSLYVYSAIATVADVIKLNKANHFVLKKGLEVINSKPYNLPFVKAIFDKLNIKNELTEYEIGFKIAPLINAATRITGEASHAVELLISNNYLETYNYLDKLIEINNNRKQLVEDYTLLAKEEYALHIDDKAIILSGCNNKYYPESIAGIIAGRFTEEYNKPTIVLAYDKDKNIMKGSARSIEGVDLYTPTSLFKDNLLSFGGHAEAYGLSLERDKVTLLREHLNNVFKNIIFKDKTKFLDLYTSLDNLPFIDNSILINTLKPFGKCFNKPLYATYGYLDTKDNTRFMKDVLVKSNLLDGNTKLNTIYFSNETNYDRLNLYLKKVILVGELQINEFRNIKTNQFKIDEIIEI